MSRHRSSRETSCSAHSEGKADGHAYSHHVLRSLEDQERKERARKRKKWKENLLIFTSEEDLSSESDVNNDAVSVFENKEELALRFPYPMVSDDSDDNEDLHSSTDSKSNVAVNMCRIKELSSNNNIKPSILENENFKHKRRKTEKVADRGKFVAKNLKENKPKNIEIKANNLGKEQSNENDRSPLPTKKQKGQISFKEGAAHESSCKDRRSASKKRNFTITKEKCEFLHRDSLTTRTRSQKNSQLYLGASVYTPGTVSPISTITDVTKNTLTFNKKAGGRNSRFLDSSSEEEVYTNVAKRHKRFKRIQVLSNTPSSSDDEIFTTTKKKDIKLRVLSTSSSESDGDKQNNEISDKYSTSSSDDQLNNKNTFLTSSNSSNGEETTTSKTNENQIQDLNFSQFKSTVNNNHPKTNRAHLVLNSSDEELNEAQPLHESIKVNNSVPVKETLPSCSSKLSSNELPSPQFVKENSDNQRIKKSDDYLKNESKKTKGNITSHSSSNVNANVWKSIANVQLNRPKSLSVNQSYLKTLKKQFLASNSPSVEINRKLNGNLSKNKGNSKPNKESWLQSNVVKEDTRVKSYCPDLSSSLQHHTDKTLVTNKENNQQIGLNLNMNLQIKCRPNPEQSPSPGESYVSRSSTKMNDETTSQKFDISLSLTGQSNNEFKLSCCDEGTNQIKLKHTEPENMKETITLQQNEQSRSQLKQSKPEKVKDAMASQRNDQIRVEAKNYELERLKKTPLYQCKDNKNVYSKDGKLKEKKENINVSQDEIKNKTSTLTENNVSACDVLGNILLEMDNNPFRVQKVKKTPEISGEMLGWGSTMPGLHPSLEAQVRLPGGLESSEKENGLLIGKSQIESKLASSTQAHVTVNSSLDLHSNNQTSPSVYNFKPNSYIEKAKPNEHLPTAEQEESLESHNESVFPVITSFYSVNSEDYNRPKEIFISKSIETSSNLSKNTSDFTSTSQPKVFHSNKTTFDNNKLKNNELCKENQTNKGLLSLVDNRAKPIVDNPVEESENEHGNDIDCEISLENRVCAEKNLKDTVYVQNVIDELTKGISRKKPPKSEKVSSNDKTLSTIPNSASGNSTISNSEESTSHSNSGSDNDFTPKSTELSKNLVNPIQEPTKGIRIRFGGNMYRLKKKNVGNKKETNLTDATDLENQQVGQIPSNTVVANNLSITSNCTESSTSSSSSSSSDSSDESESSESKDEDIVVASKKSCQSSSLKNVSVSDKKNENLVSTESSSSKNVEIDKKAKVIKEVLGSTEEVSIDKINESKMKTIKPTSAFRENKFLKGPVKSFNLDQMLGLCKKDQVTTSNIIESSGVKVRNTDNTVIISSSSESDTSEDKNDRCKIKNLRNNSVKDSLNSSIHKSGNIEDNKKVGVVDEIQKKSSNDTVQRIGKIRVRSLEELGVVNTCPLPDNALIHPRLELIRANENQNPPAESLQTDGSYPTNSSIIGPVHKEKKSECLQVNKNKKSIDPNTTEKFCKLNNAIIEPKHPQSGSCNQSTVSIPKINIIQNSTKENSVKNKPKTASSFVSTGPVYNRPQLNCKPKENNSQQFDSLSNPSTSSLNLVSSPTIPIIGSLIAVLAIPNKVNNSLESSSVQSSSVQSSSVQSSSIQSSSVQSSSVQSSSVQSSSVQSSSVQLSSMQPSSVQSSSVQSSSVQSSSVQSSLVQSSSCYIKDKQQTVNQPQTGTNVSNQPVSSTVLSDQSKTESLFFKLGDELFSEVNLLKIPKLVDDLHLVITHDVMREERLKKIDQLKCSYTKEEEKRRTGKEFADMLKVRGQAFVPLFMTIVKKIDKDNIKTLVLALYIKIIHQLEQIDPNHRSYRFKLRGLIKNMFEKNHVNSHICAIFGDKISSFTTNFNFIEELLLKYDEFVAKRKKLESASAGNAVVETNGNECQTESVVQNTEPEKSSEKVKKTKSINEIVNIAPTSEQNRENISSPNSENVSPIQLKGGSKTQTLPPTGNLDKMLFGSLNISEMKKT